MYVSFSYNYAVMIFSLHFEIALGIILIIIPTLVALMLFSCCRFAFGVLKNATVYEFKAGGYSSRFPISFRSYQNFPSFLRQLI